MRLVNPSMETGPSAMETVATSLKGDEIPRWRPQFDLL